MYVRGVFGGVFILGRRLLLLHLLGFGGRLLILGLFIPSFILARLLLLLVVVSGICVSFAFFFRKIGVTKVASLCYRSRRLDHNY